MPSCFLAQDELSQGPTLGKVTADNRHLALQMTFLPHLQQWGSGALGAPCELKFYATMFMGKRCDYS